MSRDIQLKERWEKVVSQLSHQFAEGDDDLDLDSIIYLIGVQELGKFNNKLQKRRKAKPDAYCYMPFA